MKKRILCLVILICSSISMVFASAPMKTLLYKELYYGMSKSDISRLYQFETDPSEPNELYVYSQQFLGFIWDMQLTLDNNNQLESVYLATESDDSGNKLTTVMSALGKNFVAVYAANDNETIDLFNILKKDGMAVQKSFSDFMMKSLYTSSSLNIININHESVKKASPIANSYMELLQKSPLDTRQAELIIQTYDDGSEVLGIEFSAPKSLY